MSARPRRRRPRRRRRGAPAAALLALLATAACVHAAATAAPLATAQETPPPAPTDGAEEAPAPPPCAGAEHRQFDFWAGDWIVARSDGTPAGRNRIEPILGGCALREDWQSARGFTGTSYNAVDPHTGRWHQTWVDSSGLLLRLDGGLEDGAMVLRGEAPTWDREGLFLQEITWRREGPDGVRQTGRLSEDGGATWTVLFDLLYRRAPPP